MQMVNSTSDFFSAASLTISVGHCNDSVDAKVRKQLGKLQHVSTVFATEPQAALAKKVASHHSRQSDEESFASEQRNRSE